MEDERDGGEHRVEGRRVSRQQQNAFDTWVTCARHLEPMSRATLNECMQVREKVTCEGVLFTPRVGCSRLPSAASGLALTN